MLLQYGPNDLNGDNPHFSEQAHLWLNEADYPESADQSDWEARRVLAAEMMLWEIPHFFQPEVHLVLFVNVFKYMAFLWMQESRRGDCRWQEKAAKEVQMAGNYTSGQSLWPHSDLSQPISAITCTPPGPRYNLVSKGFTQAQNTLEDPCIQTVMNVCAPSYNPVVIVEVALKVFHGDLCVGSPTDIGERSQERIEDHIISTLHQECLHRNLDPNQWVDQRAMMPRPWPQWGTASGGSGCKEDSQK